ncbi:MAG: bifunctional demethylmenaquinone methyltransferase/2-methoxy-6-polyprenyl-1,4-benzoquinol methylase UbiE [Bacteroidota bacterium]
MGKPLHNNTDDTVEQMFNRIAFRYDFLNHFLSLGIDKIWRRKLRRLIRRQKPESLLDIATGTGDMLMLLAKTSIPDLHGLDPSTGMMNKAREKFARRFPEKYIHLHTGFAEDMPIKNDRFQAATVLFGIRNFENLNAGLRDIHRVLQAGGKLYIMEFSMPKNKFVRAFYLFYLRGVIPFFGGLISRDKAAYKYLSESIRQFAEKVDLEKRLNSAGFSSIESHPLSFGVARIWVGSKDKS